VNVSLGERVVTLTLREVNYLTELCQGVRPHDDCARRSLFAKLGVADVYGAVKCAIACGFVGTYSR
jgi:hypothetical protein